MSGSISLSRIWSDDDLVELRIVASDASSSFANSVYAGHAGGGFHARLAFRDPGRLFVSTHQQNEFRPFPRDRVANEARLHLVSEPVLLDRFVRELQGLADGSREEARLACPIAPES